MGAARPAEGAQAWRCSRSSAAHASAVLAEDTEGVTTDAALDAAADAASFAGRASGDPGAMADSLWPVARISSGVAAANASTDTAADASAYATAHPTKNATRNTPEDAPEDAPLQVWHAKLHLEHVCPDAATSTLDTAACVLRLATMDAPKPRACSGWERRSRRQLLPSVAHSA